MEETLYEFGVDVIFAGHVHAYERSHPVYGESVPVSLSWARSFHGIP